MQQTWTVTKHDGPYHLGLQLQPSLCILMHLLMHLSPSRTVAFKHPLFTFLCMAYAWLMHGLCVAYAWLQHFLRVKTKLNSCKISMLEGSGVVTRLQSEVELSVDGFESTARSAQKRLARFRRNAFFPHLAAFLCGSRPSQG